MQRSGGAVVAKCRHFLNNNNRWNAQCVGVLLRVAALGLSGDWQSELNPATAALDSQAKVSHCCLVALSSGASCLLQVLKAVFIGYFCFGLTLLLSFLIQF